MRNQFFGVLHCCGQNAVQEINQPLGVGCVLVIKVDTVVFCADFENLVIGAVLEDQLFY